MLNFFWGHKDDIIELSTLNIYQFLPFFMSENNHGNATEQVHAYRRTLLLKMDVASTLLKEL